MPRTIAIAGVVVALAVVASNLDGGLRFGYHFLRSQAGMAKADLAALELGRAAAPPNLRLIQPVADNPYLSGVTADRFFSQTAAHGLPAIYSDSELAAASANERHAADGVLLSAERIMASGVSSRITGSGCRSGLVYGGRTPDLRVSPGTWVLSDAGRQGMAIGMRRFATAADTHYIALIAPGASEQIVIPADRSSRPWQLDAKSGSLGAGKLTVCPARSG